MSRLSKHLRQVGALVLAAVVAAAAYSVHEGQSTGSSPDSTATASLGLVELPFPSVSKRESSAHPGDRFSPAGTASTRSAPLLGSGTRSRTPSGSAHTDLTASSPPSAPRRSVACHIPARTLRTRLSSQDALTTATSTASSGVDRRPTSAAATEAAAAPATRSRPTRSALRRAGRGRHPARASRRRRIQAPSTPMPASTTPLSGAWTRRISASRWTKPTIPPASLGRPRACSHSDSRAACARSAPEATPAPANQATSPATSIAPV